MSFPDREGHFYMWNGHVVELDPDADSQRIVTMDGQLTNYGAFWRPNPKWRKLHNFSEPHEAAAASENSDGNLKAQDCLSETISAKVAGDSDKKGVKRKSCEK